MHTQPIPAPLPSTGPRAELRLDGLLRTHWTLAVCPRCQHEQARAEHCTAPCPGCGGPLRAFALYQSLTAAATR